MKKSEQLAINEKVMIAYNAMCCDVRVYQYTRLHWTRLRSCSAEVTSVGSWYILRSYDTIVAAIDRETDTLYDFLRYVYGYTSTSAQHISKFRKDYGAGTWGCAHEYTWREV